MEELVLVSIESQDVARAEGLSIVIYGATVAAKEALFTDNSQIDLEVLSRGVLKIHPASVGALIFVPEVLDPQKWRRLSFLLEPSSSSQTAIVPMTPNLGPLASNIKAEKKVLMQPGSSATAVWVNLLIFRGNFPTFESRQQLSKVVKIRFDSQNTAALVALRGTIYGYLLVIFGFSKS